ncbi:MULTISPECIES: PaaI family thioesterase [Rheinheimera]|uniref:PaaI family thioesterase n=1 Tax=Rheinheimera marina TaxID=1774958 RepID=A0ABV9JIA5_9GAMM
MNALRKANWQLWWFGFRYIPLIGFCKPKIIELDDQRTVIRMPHHRHTKNHLGSIYFGALAIGADLAGAFLVFYKARQRGLAIHFAFKDVKGEFLKRPEADVHFVSNDGALIDQMIEQSLQTGERVNQSVTINVTCPSLNGDEVMARFELTLSIKAKKR